MEPTKGTKTKNRIVEVATDLFLQEGLYNVTFQQIASGVGLSQPAIYRHFSDMDDLILYSCQHWVDQSLEYIHEASESLEKASFQLEQYVDRHLAYAHKHRAHDGLLFGLYYYSMRSKKMLSLYQQIKARAVSRISRILTLGNLDHSWKVEEIGEMSETIHSVVVAEVIKQLIEPRAETTASRTRRVNKHLRILLGSKSRRSST